MLKTKLYHYYGISYINDYSVKSETIFNTWIVDSCESTVAFSGKKSKCLDIGVLYVEVEIKSRSYLFDAFQAGERVQNEEQPS